MVTGGLSFSFKMVCIFSQIEMLLPCASILIVLYQANDILILHVLQFFKLYSHLNSC